MALPAKDCRIQPSCSALLSSMPSKLLSCVLLESPASPMLDSEGSWAPSHPGSEPTHSLSKDSGRRDGESLETAAASTRKLRLLGTTLHFVARLRCAVCTAPLLRRCLHCVWPGAIRVTTLHSPAWKKCNPHNWYFQIFLLQFSVSFPDFYLIIHFGV